MLNQKLILDQIRERKRSQLGHVLRSDDSIKNMQHRVQWKAMEEDGDQKTCDKENW